MLKDWDKLLILLLFFSILPIHQTRLGWICVNEFSFPLLIFIGRHFSIYDCDVSLLFLAGPLISYLSNRKTGKERRRWND